MKKLTIKALNEMLKKHYFIGNVKSIIKDNSTFIICYSFYMVRLSFNKDFGWCFCIYGEVLYSTAKYYVEIVNELEGNYYIEGENK